MSEGTTYGKLLKEGEAIGVSPKGRSMLPLMREGKTQVVIEPVDRDLIVGEMPIYMRKDGTYVLHRIVGMDEKNYHIRGDNCVALEIVPKTDVLGVVTELRLNGRLVHPTDLLYRLYVRLLMATEWPRLHVLRLRARAGRLYRRYIKKRTE